MTSTKCRHDWSHLVRLKEFRETAKETIQPIESVGDLGVYLDSEFNMQAHITESTQACFFQLWRLQQIRCLLGRDVTASLVSTFFTVVDGHRHLRAVAYSVELVLLNKHKIWGDAPKLDCYPNALHKYTICYHKSKSMRYNTNASCVQNVSSRTKFHSNIRSKHQKMQKTGNSNRCTFAFSSEATVSHFKIRYHRSPSIMIKIDVDTENINFESLIFKKMLNTYSTFMRFTKCVS